MEGIVTCLDHPGGELRGGENNLDRRIEHKLRRSADNVLPYPVLPINPQKTQTSVTACHALSALMTQ